MPNLHRQIAVSIASVLAGIPLLSGSCHAAMLAADYQLQNTYASSVGTIGALTPVGDTSDVSFATATVRGNSQTVLSFEDGQSLATPPTFDEGGVQAKTNGFISPTNYSVALLASFNFSADPVATKLLDFKNLSSDSGLYVNDTTGLLDFNGAPATAIGGTPVVAGNYSEIVLTRDGTTGLTTVYQDGTQAFSFTDSSNLATLGDSSSMSTSQFLTLFLDDGMGLGGTIVNESTIGTLARLRLFDGPLTATEVASLDNPPSTPEPASAGLVLLGTAAFLRRRRV